VIYPFHLSSHKHLNKIRGASQRIQDRDHATATNCMADGHGLRYQSSSAQPSVSLQLTKRGWKRASSRDTRNAEK